MKLACKYHKDSNTITLCFPNKFDSINLSDGSVTAAKLASGSVTTLKIVDEAIKAVKLATASITSEKVATAAIGSSHLQDALVTTAKIANLAVDTSRLANLTITAGKLASNCVEASKIANLAVGAAAIASLAVGTAKIADAAILEAKIDNAAVTSAKIFDAAIVSAKIADLAVIDAKIGSVNANKINAGYLNANRIEAGSIVLSKITGLGDLATENNLDGVSNGTTYSRVLTTAISAGKIVLTSAGVTGTLPTSLSAAKCIDATADKTSTHTAANAFAYTGALIATSYTTAKCTDANADQTSAHNCANPGDYTASHGQNLGWLIGSTGELTISSGGKLKINAANALEIMAAGDIKIMAGGDLRFVGSSYTTSMNNTASGNVFYITASTSSAVQFVASVFQSIRLVASEYAELTAKTDNSNKASVKVSRSGGSSFVAFDLIDEGVTKRIQAQYENNTHYSFGPTVTGECNLGTSSVRWKEAYFENVSAATDNANGWASVFSNDGNNANRYGIKIQCGLDNDNGEQHHIYFYDGNGSYQGTLSNDTSGNLVLLNASDKKLKANIVNAPDFDTDKIINGLQLREYDLRGSPGCSGLVAQEVQTVFPEMITEIETKEDGTLLCVEANTKLTFVLLQAVKELKAEMGVLKGEKL